MKRSIKSGRAYRNVALIFATLVMAVSPLLPLYEASAAPINNQIVSDLSGWRYESSDSTFSLTSGGLVGTTNDKIMMIKDGVNYPLSSQTSTIEDTIRYTDTANKNVAAVLFVDFDGTGNPNTTGWLIGEDYYAPGDQRWWMTGSSWNIHDNAPHTDCTGTGSTYCGTLAEWSSKFPSATVVSAGVQLARVGTQSNTITSLLAGDTRYIFSSTITFKVGDGQGAAKPLIPNGTILNPAKLTNKAPQINLFGLSDDARFFVITPDGTKVFIGSQHNYNKNAQTFNLNRGDGLYSFFAEDISGNLSDPYNIYVDTAAPEFSISVNSGIMPLDGTAQYSNQGDLEVVITATDPQLYGGYDGSGVQLVYLINGATYGVSPTTVYGNQISFTIPAGTLADGTHTFSLQAYDNVGNITNNGFALDYTFKTDSTSPSLYIKAAPDSNKATNSKTGVDWYNKISFNATDATGFQAFELNGNLRNDPKGPGGWADYNWQNITRSFLKEGVNTIAAIDKNGNRTELKFNFDSVGPVISVGSFTGDKDAAIFSDLSINFNDIFSGLGKVEIKDEGGNVVWSRAQGGESFSNIDGIGSRSYYGLSTGKYTFVAYDILGNSSEYEFELDLLAPTITINGEAPKAAYNLSDGDLAIKVTDAPTNLNLSHCVVNGTEFGRDYNKTWGLDVNAKMTGWSLYREGENTITCYDKAGNSTTATFIIDRVAPVISNIHIESDNDNPNYAKAGDTISVSFDVTEPIRSLDAGIRLASAGGRVTLSGNTESPSTCVDMGGYYTCTLTYVVQAGDSNGLVEFFLNGYRDAAGNPGVAMSQDDIEDDSYVIIDTEAPTGTITYDPSTWTNGDVIATLTTSEPVQAIAGWTKVDDTTFTKVYTRNTIENVRFTDLAGNEGSTLARVQIIDRANPVVMLDLRDITKLFGWTNQDYDLRATAFDLPLFGGSGIASIEYTFDGVCDEDSTWITGSVATATENGKLCFRATDNAGNTSRILEIGINNIDKVAPALNPEYWTKTVEADKDATFTCPTANPTDNASGATYVMHNSNVNMGVPGSYKCQYKTTDGAGNVSWNDVFITVVDTTPPTFHPEYWTKIVEADRSGTPFTCPTAYGTDKAAGTVTVTMHNSNVDITTPGSYKCQYVTEDANGNKAWNDVFITVVDTTAPDVSISVAPTIIIGREANGYYNYATVRLNLVNSDDSNDFLTYSINGGAYQNYTRALNITADTEICAIAADIYGNESEPVCETILIDRDAPVVTDVTLDPETLTNGDVTVIITAEDDKSGLAANACIFGSNMVEVALRALLGLGWGACETTVATNGTVYYAVRDNLGNITYGSKVVENIDKTLPTVDSVIVNGQVIEKGDTVTVDCTDTEIEITVEASDANMAWLEAKLQQNIGDIQVGEGSQKGVNTITFTISVADLLAADTDDFELWIQTGDLAGNHYNEAFGFNIFIDQTACTEIPCDGCEGGSGNGGQEDNGEIVSSTTRDWTYAYDNGDQEVLGDTDEETGDINGEKNNQDVAGETDENKDESAADSWALLNLLMAVLAALIAVGAMIRRSDKENGALRTGTIVVAFVAIVAFVITQNMTLPMTFADNWSILMVALAVINIGLIAGLIKSSDKDDSKK